MPHGRDPRGRGGVWCAGIVCRATHQTWAGRSTARRRFGRPRGRAYRFISHRRAVRGRPREERERKGRTSASSREPASTSLAREPHPLTFVRIFCFLFFCSSETKNKKNTKQKYKRERRGGGPRRGLEARKSKAGRLDFARLPMVGGVRWVLVKLCPRSERLLAHDRRLCSTAAAAHPTKTRAPFDIAEFKDRRPRYDRANRCRGYKLPPSACMKKCLERYRTFGQERFSRVAKTTFCRKYFPPNHKRKRLLERPRSLSAAVAYGLLCSCLAALPRVGLLP